MSITTKLSENIRLLRTFYGETQEQLAEALHVEKSTISNYENNIRTPDNEMLNRIAKHFTVSVEQLQYADCTGLGKCDYDERIYWKNIDKSFPIVYSKEALKNEPFKKAVSYHKLLYRGFHHFEWNPKSQLEPYFDKYADYIIFILNNYKKAYDEDSILEAAANYISVVFLLKSLAISFIEAIGNKTALLKQITAKSEEVARLIKNDDFSNEGASDLLRFLEEFEQEDSLLKKLTELKRSNRYSDIADYYLSLQYLNGMINDEMTIESKQMIGFEMLKTFASVGNRYAIEKLTINKEILCGSSQSVNDK